MSAPRPVLTLAELEGYDRGAPAGGRERRFRCPLPECRDKTNRNLSLNTQSGLWDCYRCGAAGRLRERWEPPPPRGRYSPALSRARMRPALSPERQPGRAASAPLLPGLVERCRPLAGSPGENYLLGRGIDVATAIAAGVTFCADVYGRPGVVFPLHDRTGQLVAVNVRHTDGRDTPKTHSVGDRSLGVFAAGNHHNVMIAPLVVVEGPMDALSLAECDVAAVALVATRAPRWLRATVAFRPVVVALDADEAGDAGAGVLAEELRPFARSVARLRPPQGKDWNDALLADYPGLVDFLEGQLGG